MLFFLGTLFAFTLVSSCALTARYNSPDHLEGNKPTQKQLLQKSEGLTQSEEQQVEDEQIELQQQEKTQQDDVKEGNFIINNSQVYDTPLTADDVIGSPLLTWTRWRSFKVREQA